MDTKIKGDGAPNLRQSAKAKTRNAIMKAAQQLFSKQGVDETRAEDIARRAKVGVGTIYLHFGDKEGLLREILLEAAGELYKRVQEVYQGPAISRSVLAGAYVQTLVEYVEERGRTAGLVLGLMISGQQTTRPMLDRAIEQVEEHIRNGQQRGFYRRDLDPRLAARAQVQMSLGLLAWWADDPRRAAREDIVATLTKMGSSALGETQVVE